MKDRCWKIQSSCVVCSRPGVEMLLQRFFANGRLISPSFHCQAVLPAGGTRILRFVEDRIQTTMVSSASISWGRTGCAKLGDSFVQGVGVRLSHSWSLSVCFFAVAVHEAGVTPVISSHAHGVDHRSLGKIHWISHMWAYEWINFFWTYLACRHLTELSVLQPSTKYLIILSIRSY